MAPPLPQLSRFELQVLRLLWTRSEASVADLHGDIPDGPSYSTIRKIVERLEQKGAIERVRLDDKAVIYRAAVPRTAVIRREIRSAVSNPRNAPTPAPSTAPGMTPPSPSRAREHITPTAAP